MTTALRHLLSAAVLSTVFCFAACSGSDNDPGPSKLRISADKNTLTADGSDAVTFTAMYGSTDVSRSENMRLVRISDGQETELSAGINTFTATAPGDYTFKARYRDGEITVESENSVGVTATAGTAGNYFRKLFFMQFTSVGCINCPTMSSALKVLQAERPGLLTAVSLHLQYDPNYPDPMWIRINDTYGQKFNVTGLPTAFLNLHPQLRMSSDMPSIEKAIETAQEEPTTCGVAIASTYDAASREVTVDVKITSDVSEVYRYLILLVEDGVPYFQLGADEEEYTHNNVVRAILSSNVYGERLNQGAALQPGVEATARRSTTLDAAWVPANMRVIVAALTSNDGGVTFVCNNVNECPLDANADYLYNK